ncbi:MAG: AAA family ATPase [Lachnospiraceae bacterium]
MGIYLNPGNGRFQQAINSKIYVDKTELIRYTNSILQTEDKYICVSRPRRFGKSIAASMLMAYYSRGCDSREQFAGYKIAKDESFEKHLNQYDVIFLNMQEFLSRSKDMTEMLARIKNIVTRDLLKEYPDVDYFDSTDLVQSMQDVYVETNRPFVVIVDEWDCIFREHKRNKEAQEQYLDFLRDFFKDKDYIYLAYMTGILPIKKYGTHSALNMFQEYSMLNARNLAEFVGFTETEVSALCEEYGMNMEDMKSWYDGYHFEEAGSIYSPRSVVSSLLSKKYDNYWNQTETFEALRVYIDMNFEGIRDDVLAMMAGERVPVNTSKFTNDMTTFETKDDVFTLLIHLGYLAYDFENKCVYIPNNEIRNEYVNAVSVSEWGEVSRALRNSAQTLEGIWKNRPSQVVEGIEQAHFETAHIQYNDENALSYTISLALYAARNFYTVYREFPTGKGFADMVYIPRKKFPDKPALVIELKWDKSAEGAIAQIKKKQYCRSLEDYKGNLILVGINYDKVTREHECLMEEWTME